MLKYQVKLEDYILVHAFINIRTSFIRAAKALASLRICADSHEPSLFTDAISTEITCTVPYIYIQYSNISKRVLAGARCSGSGITMPPES